MTDSVECVVVGAGVVGLAIARELAGAGLETLVLERESRIGTGASSRNSEVIHAGIYYPPGSLKAETCVAGKGLLYDYCAARNIEFRRCGKLVVATAESQVPELQAIVARARQCGVHDLELITAADIHALEPELCGVAGVLSPSTGIVDSHALMLSFQGDFERAGGVIAFRSPVAGGRCEPGRIRLEAGENATTSLAARYVVNCAGLDAPALAAALAGFPASSVPSARYAKGSYFALSGKAPFSRLIYPVPEPGGLGVHLTLDLAGQARFGPDVEWVDDLDYAVDPARGNDFYARIRRYWPGLEDGALVPAYAGIRAKLHGPDEPPADFLLQGEESHGVAGLVNLFGIESPGLTASLAIARKVRQLLLQN
jgi:L-2-hydroxyglutarate oxidase LhgO